jgi:hypothetical protein
VCSAVQEAVATVGQAGGRGPVVRQAVGALLWEVTAAWRQAAEQPVVRISGP